MVTPSPDVTQLLLDLGGGQQAVMDRLFPLVYDELRRVAHNRLARHAALTLDTTGLVHEAYIKLVDQTRVDWQDRSHFFAVAARAMRFLLVDYARKRGAQKRGGDQVRVALRDDDVLAEQSATDVLALHEALDLLEKQDERLARVVEYRFFTGLSVQEVAALLGTSDRTIKRDWAKARLFLYRVMHDDDGEH